MRFKTVKKSRNSPVFFFSLIMYLKGWRNLLFRSAKGPKGLTDAFQDSEKVERESCFFF